jgi:autotransporter passenger strand-loop-strand repeat protein
MTDYFIPPDSQPPILVSGDEVNVQKGGVVRDLLVVPSSDLNVMDYGQAFNTTIHGQMIVTQNGQVFTATVFGDASASGFLGVGGASQVTAATVNTGGILNVGSDGAAFATTLQGGTLKVFPLGVANDVSFGEPAPGGGPHQNLVDLLGAPTTLTGTITGFQIGDRIDFVDTNVTSASAANGVLTVTYGPKAETANYFLANQQPNTTFTLQSDGDNGTNLILTPTVAQPPLVAPKQLPSDVSGDTDVVLGKTGATDGAAIIGVQSLHETAGHQVLV